LDEHVGLQVGGLSAENKTGTFTLVEVRRTAQ
jgi:hypothetical protein